MNNHGLHKSLQQVSFRLDSWIHESLLEKLNIYMENTLKFIFIVHYQEVHILNCLMN